MQEHIRRAHPDHYIPKLPATEESFLLMVNTPPTQRPQPQPTSAPSRRGPCMIPSSSTMHSADCKKPVAVTGTSMAQTSALLPPHELSRMHNPQQPMLQLLWHSFIMIISVLIGILIWSVDISRPWQLLSPEFVSNAM
jgi:hypothetical protein